MRQLCLYSEYDLWDEAPNKLLLSEVREWDSCVSIVSTTDEMKLQTSYFWASPEFATATS